MRTYVATPKTIDPRWYIIDATDQTLGPLATKVATYLTGKRKPEYTRHIDVGDYIVVINAKNVKVTGKKTQNKVYERYSGYSGGKKTITFEKLQQKHPERIIEKAVKGMLPKSPIGYAMLRKLKVYKGNTHPHLAQNPLLLENI